MINIYLIVLLTIAFIASIVRAILLKNIVVGVVSSVLSILLTALLSYLTLYQAFLYQNEFFLLKVIVASLVLVGVLISLIPVERKVIFHIAASNAFFIFVASILPFLTTFSASAISDSDFLINGLNFKNIIGSIILYLFFFGALILNMYLGRSKGINRSNVYLKDINKLKHSTKQSDQNKYANYQKFLYSVESTFYPISYYGLFIVSIIVVALSSISFDEAIIRQPIKSIFYRDYAESELIGTEYSYYDHYDNLVVIYERDSDAVGIRRYNTCVVDMVSQAETCIDTIRFAFDNLSTGNGLYFKSGDELYYYEDEVLTRVLEHEYGILLDDFYLYKIDQKVFLESDDYKWELIGHKAYAIEEFTPLNQLGQVEITQGHLLIKTSESTTIIDGIEYDIDVDLNYIQFYENVITNGLYEFKDGTILPFGTQIASLKYINGEYYTRIGSTQTDFFVNIRNEYDVINLPDYYIYRNTYLTDDNGDTYEIERDSTADLGVKLNLQAQYPYVNFSVLWTVVLYYVLTGLYFVLKKETYRIR